jgi:formamidopyrimidine-DNA glycosylase
LNFQATTSWWKLPELPEVETVVRTLAPRLAGRRILEARFYSKRVMRGAPDPPIAGLRVQSVSRHGKNILIALDGGILAVHLGMTGKLLIDAEPTPHTRAVITLDQGVLLYDDIRQFGRIGWSEALPRHLELLGPDALSITAEQLAAMLKPRRSRIKPLLLNQQFLSGLGNIYCDEALFRAGIHPRALAARLSRARIARLHSAIDEVLSLAIEKGGSSISDYVDTEGRKGSFQLFHQVYGKEGEPCVRCATPVKRIVVAQRGTHFCPKCQK